MILVANIASQATIYAVGPSFAIQAEGTAPGPQISGGDGSNGSAQGNGATAATMTTAQWRHLGKAVVVLSAVVLVLTSF